MRFKLRDGISQQGGDKDMHRAAERDELKGADSGSAAMCLHLAKNILLVSHSESSSAPWCGATPVPSPCGALSLQDI